MQLVHAPQSKGTAVTHPYQNGYTTAAKIQDDDTCSETVQYRGAYFSLQLHLEYTDKCLEPNEFL